MTNKHQLGFTFIELLLYMTLLTFFITGAILFVWNIINAREKTMQQQLVQQEARRVMARITYEIHRAKNLQSVNTSQLILTNSTGTTTIESSGGVVQITTGGVGPYNLTSNLVRVTTLTFTNLSSTNNNTKNIQTTLVVEQAPTQAPQTFLAKTSVTQSTELRGQFNQARGILINATTITKSGGSKTLGGIQLSNVSGTTLTFDKLNIDWINGPAGLALNSVTLNGNTVWSGTAGQGAIVELTNTPITSSQTFPFSLTFSGNITGATITFSLIMLDGSSEVVKIIVT